MPATGLNEMLESLGALPENVRQALGRAVYESALEVEGLSRDMTPYDTGALEGSHETHPPVFAGDDVTALITVGGPAAPYAMYVHENLDARHDHGQAKFLESAVLAYKGDYRENVAERIAAILGA